MKVLIFGSFGFAAATYFVTLGLLAYFGIAGIEEVPEEIASANLTSLGAMIGSFTAVVNHLLG